MIEQLPVRPDVLLLIVGIALYLLDAAQLLFSNEMLFVRASGGSWHARIPRGEPGILGRFLFLPRPLEPDIAILRLSWPRSRDEHSLAPGEIKSRIEQNLMHLVPIKWLSAFLLPQLFLGLPLVYLLSGGSLARILVMLSLMYAQVLLMIGVLVAKRAAFGMRWTTILRISFESLICLPDAINLYRKATAYALSPGLSVLDVGKALLPLEDLSDFHQILAAATDEQLYWSSRDSASARELAEFRKSIERQIHDNV